MQDCPCKAKAVLPKPSYLTLLKIAGTMLDMIQQGGIYKLPFPYTGRSEQKYRPAIAITAPDHTGDVKFVFVTTMPPVPPAQRLALGPDDFVGAAFAHSF